ncbi:MAG: hypothetical protein DHS20C18_32460 [Saprospiraceae bacterium]|nr:MAG: hypothetical protein DHS20C18_32460 [Saprospiraceae bacterium]
MISENDKLFMKEAIRLALQGMRTNHGGPFGAVIVREGQIIGRGYNKVTSSNDPTAHAEIVAIRNACHELGTFQLTGCTLYTSCEPCPMCLGAIYWARPDRIVYAATHDDAARIAGFDDQFIYEEMALPINQRKIPSHQALHDEGLEVFREWNKKTDRLEY